MTSTRRAIVAAILSLAVPAAHADELSVEEVRALFERQIAAFDEAEKSELGQTRGLKLVTVEDVFAETVEKLSQEPEDTAVKVSTGADEPLIFGKLDPDLQVNLRIAFEFDSAALLDSEKPKLQTVCTVLQTTPINLIRIVGHTDSSGTAQYNEHLSVLRAREVARYLIEDCKIAPPRLQSVGMGERFPFKADEPRAPENRRVEFQALS